MEESNKLFFGENNIYFSRIIPHKYCKEQNLFELKGDPVGIRKWMDTWFPKAGNVRHVQLREQSLQASGNLHTEMIQYANAQFKQQFGRPMSIWDIQDKVIITKKFPEQVQEQLRTYDRYIRRYRSIAWAHNEMLPKYLKTEIHL